MRRMSATTALGGRRGCDSQKGDTNQGGEARQQSEFNRGGDSTRGKDANRRGDLGRPCQQQWEGFASRRFLARGNGSHTNGPPGWPPGGNNQQQLAAQVAEMVMQHMSSTRGSTAQPSEASQFKCLNPTYAAESQDVACGPAGTGHGEAVEHVGSQHGKHHSIQQVRLQR